MLATPAPYPDDGSFATSLTLAHAPAGEPEKVPGAQAGVPDAAVAGSTPRCPCLCVLPLHRLGVITQATVGLSSPSRCFNQLTATAGATGHM